MRDEPDAKILRALGRIAWWAISLEDVVGSLASSAGVWDMKSPAGDLVIKSIKAMKGMKPAPAIDAAILWAQEVDVLLKRRNSIMHGTPMVNTARLDDLGYLQYLPRDRSGVVDTALTPEALNVVADDLQQAYSRWRDVTVDLYTIVRQRRNLDPA